MAGRSCAEVIIRDRAGVPVTVTGTALDVNATLGIITVPDGDVTILESTTVLPTGGITLVAAANATRRFIQIQFEAGTAGQVAYLGLTGLVGAPPAVSILEMADGGVFWIDSAVIVGSTFYMVTADPLSGYAHVLEY
jgi:hypothetical protein